MQDQRTISSSVLLLVPNNILLIIIIIIGTHRTRPPHHPAAAAAPAGVGATSGSRGSGLRRCPDPPLEQRKKGGKEKEGRGGGREGGREGRWRVGSEGARKRDNDKLVGRMDSDGAGPGEGGGPHWQHHVLLDLSPSPPAAAPARDGMFR